MKTKKAREYTSSKEINKITVKNSTGGKGSFLIGYNNPETGKFRPRYVGISFNDLMAEIVRSSKKAENVGFDRYRLIKTKTKLEAWNLACKTYHEFKVINNLTNEGHAEWKEQTGGIKLTCPIESCNN
jgi:hypothetical protein